MPTDIVIKFLVGMWLVIFFTSNMFTSQGARDGLKVGVILIGLPLTIQYLTKNNEQN